MPLDSETYYYVAPLKSEENTGIQHCAFFDADWRRLWPPVQLTACTGTSVRIEQVSADNPHLPKELRQHAVDPDAKLAGVAVRTCDQPDLPNLIQVSDDGPWVSVPVAGNVAGITRGAILLFSISGPNFSLRATTDPQIRNSGPGMS